jgi:hypothetical protein
VDGGGNTLIGCLSFVNGLDTDRTYDAFLVNGSDNLFTGCRIANYAYGNPGTPIYNIFRNGFNATNGSATQDNKFVNNVIGTGACSVKDYALTGTQKAQCIAHQTSALISGRRTSVVEGDLVVTDGDQTDGMLIQKFNQPNADAGEKLWIVRPNYAPTYKQLLYAIVDDAFANEDIWMVVDRTGAVVNSVRFPHQIILDVAPNIPNYGAEIKQSNAGQVVQRYKVSDAPADGKVWEWRALAGSGYNALLGALQNDAEDTGVTFFRVDRTGMVVDQVTLTAALITLTGTVALGTPLAVGSGGTGVATLADHGVLLGSAAAAVTVTTPGTADQVLTSNGASADPSFKDLAVANFGSQTAKYFLAAPNAGNGTPSFRAIVASDVPTLNQNTSGTAAGLSATLAVASGGTNATTAADARTSLDVYSKAEADALAKFTDRGDPASADKILTGLTVDGAWHDWDLSSGIPAGATAVILRVSLGNNSSNGWLMFRKNGNSNETNVAMVNAPVANVAGYATVTVACDSGRVIEYYVANNGTYAFITITVAGWLK